MAMRPYSFSVGFIKNINVVTAIMGRQTVAHRNLLHTCTFESLSGSGNSVWQTRPWFTMAARLYLLQGQRAFSTKTTAANQSVTDQYKFISGYEDIPELQSAPETVKRIFSLSNANQYEHRRIARHKIKENYDHRAERAIAEMTQRINVLTKHCQEKKKDNGNKVFLQWVIDQRKKKLKHMKLARFDRYLALIRELDIPPLQSPHTKWNKYKFRKFKIGVKVKRKKSVHDRRVIQ